MAAVTASYFLRLCAAADSNDPAYGADQDPRRSVLYRSGLTSRTTLDPGLQRVAQEQVNATIAGTDPPQRGAALVSIEPGTGNIRTMAQNTAYNPAPVHGNYMGNFDLPANDANGQPLDGAGGFQLGSTIKPFIFAQWLNAGKSMNTVLNGAVRDYPPGFPGRTPAAPPQDPMIRRQGPTCCPTTTPTTTTR